MAEKKEKKEKKKLLRVEGFDSDDFYYSDAELKNTYPQFAFMSSPENGRKQCFPFESCRDSLHEYLGSFIGSDNLYNDDYESDMPPVDFDRFRLLVQYGDKNSSDSYKKRLFAAKRVLNHYEQLAGWEKQSVITTVKHSKCDHVWLLTGPAEWMFHPCLVSAATLILRFCTANGPIEFKDQKELDKKIKNLCSKKSVSDAYIMKDVYDKLPMLLKEYKKIFDRGSIVKNYTITSGFHGHTGGGILSLCNFESIDKKANSTLKSMLSKKK